MATRPIGAVAVLAIIAGGLAGCASSQPQPVNVVADSFCIAAKKKTWSVNDTPATIEQIRKHNAGIDRACGIPGKVKVASTE